jgi:hypothetical protein
VAEAIVAAVEAFEQTAAEMTDYRESVVGLPMTERMTDLEMVI